MSRTPSLRSLLWALAGLAALHLGPQCGEMPPAEPMADLRFDTVSVANLGGGGYIAWMDVLVDTPEEFQAWEMTLTWDADTLDLNDATAHTEFDDDGRLAVEATAANESAGPFADLRHGPPPGPGLTRVATLLFRSSDGAPATITVSGKVARPDGSVMDMAPVTPVTVP